MFAFFVVVVISPPFKIHIYFSFAIHPSHTQIQFLIRIYPWKFTRRNSYIKIGAFSLSLLKHWKYANGMIFMWFQQREKCIRNKLGQLSFYHVHFLGFWCEIVFFFSSFSTLCGWVCMCTCLFDGLIITFIRHLWMTLLNKVTSAISIRLGSSFHYRWWLWWELTQCAQLRNKNSSR